MKLGQKAIVFGLLTFGGYTTCAVIAHYAELWALFLLVAAVFSLFGAITIATNGE